MKKKYVITPGSVFSRIDGQRHYITAPQLMRLYGVTQDECVIVNPMFEKPPEGLIVLAPRYDGQYTLPSEAGASL
jgi:hypothetical protein